MQSAQAKKNKAPSPYSGIDRLLDSGVFKNASIGIRLVDIESGKVLYERNQEQALVPASLTKLVTATYALHILTMDFRFTTTLKTTGAIRNGVLRGNLYLVGGGDPMLEESKLRHLALALQSMGIHTVTGDLVGDSSFFDDKPYDDSWGSMASPERLAPLGALSLNRNRVTARVLPAIKNQPPFVKPSAMPFGYKIVNRAVTSATDSAPHLKVGVHQGVFTVDGQIPENGEPQEVSTFVDDPVHLSLVAFRRVAGNAGVSIKGKNRSGNCPESSKTVTQVASRPLTDLLGVILKESDNFSSEMLLRTLGAVVYGPPGTKSKGLNAVADSMKRLGVETSGNRIHDASGLSRNNMLSPRLLTDFLTAAAYFPQLQTQLVAELPEAGREGTMKGRFQGKRIPGVLLAKTGRLTGVLGMAGYFWTPDGHARSFAILMNGYPQSLSEKDAMRLQDEIVLLLMHIP